MWYPSISPHLFFLYPQVPPLFPFSVCPVSCLLSIHPLCTVYHFGSYYSFQEGRCIQLPKWDSLLLIKYFLSKLLPHPLHFLFFIPFLSFFFLPYSSFTHLLVFHLLAFSLGFVFLFYGLIYKEKKQTLFSTCVSNLKLYPGTYEAHFHESTAHGTSTVNDSRGTWQNKYNTVGNSTVTGPGLQPDQSNHIFSCL